MKIKLLRIGMTAFAVSALYICPVWADDQTNSNPYSTNTDPTTQMPQGRMRPPPPPPRNMQQQPGSGVDSSNQLWPNPPSNMDTTNQGIPGQSGQDMGPIDSMMGAPGMRPGRGGPGGNPGGPQDMMMPSDSQNPSNGMGSTDNNMMGPPPGPGRGQGGPGNNMMVPPSDPGSMSPSSNSGDVSRATPINKRAAAKKLKKTSRKSSVSKQSPLQ